MSLQANIKNTFFDQKSPQHQDVGVLGLAHRRGGVGGNLILKKVYLFLNCVNTAKFKGKKISTVGLHKGGRSKYFLNKNSITFFGENFIITGQY